MAQYAARISSEVVLCYHIYCCRRLKTSFDCLACRQAGTQSTAKLVPYSHCVKCAYIIRFIVRKIIHDVMMAGTPNEVSIGIKPASVEPRKATNRGEIDPIRQPGNRAIRPGRGTKAEGN